MLSSDLQTLTLADLFQWLDQSRKSGTIDIECDNEPPLWLRVVDRVIVAGARPAETMPGLKNLSGWVPAIDPAKLWPDALADRIIDLFVAPGDGRYTFTAEHEGGEGPLHDGGVPLELHVTQMTLEGMRRLDEWPDLERAYPSESALLKEVAAAERTVNDAGLAAVLDAARRQLTIGEARLAMGLSKPAMLRRVEALREMLLVNVEGISRRIDPVSQLIDKAQALMREGQFDEAGLVFKSLLAADPADRRVRNLMREAEREQVAALYQELSPFAIASVTDVIATPETPIGKRLNNGDREVLNRINGRWDVASVALASPMREVETLKSLRKMERLGVIRPDRGATR